MRLPETTYYDKETREIKMTWFGSISAFLIASVGAFIGLVITIALLGGFR